MPNETSPDTNFKVIDTRSPDTQARKAGGDNTDYIGDAVENAPAQCPVCGGEPFIVNISDTDFEFIVRCGECGVRLSKTHSDRKAAIAAWNLRTSEPVDITSVTLDTDNLGAKEMMPLPPGEIVARPNP